MTENQKQKLRLLPAVHEVVAGACQSRELGDRYSAAGITWAARRVLDKAREKILNSIDPEEVDLFLSEIQEWLLRELLKELQGSNSTLRRVINATGVVLHTNCGRAPLAKEAADFVAEQAKYYSSLELDLESGQRGSRYVHTQDLLAELTGAEDSLVVNNNAAAVLLIMNTFAMGKEVIVSRGELVEVGGSFRIPEVLLAGGAKLTEVGTTNKTWLKDYREAINENTAMLLKVHTSNYRIEGFAHSVPTSELAQLGREFGLPVVEDLGSGSFLDGTELGLPREPTIQEAVLSGASLVSFSGDKLLGGPQAGIIVGKKELIENLKRNQLTRALRVDKLTLAALAATLRLYQRGETDRIPVWQMLSRSKQELETQTEYLCKSLRGIAWLEAEVEENTSRVGGGAFPTAELPSAVCALKPLRGSVDELELFLRQGGIPILARIYKEKVLLDPRTLLAEDYEVIISRMQEWGKEQ